MYDFKWRYFDVPVDHQTLAISTPEKQKSMSLSKMKRTVTQSNHTSKPLAPKVGDNNINHSQSQPIIISRRKSTRDIQNSQNNLQQSAKPSNIFLDITRKIVRERSHGREKFNPRINHLTVANYPTAVWIDPQDEYEPHWWPSMFIPSSQLDSTMPPLRKNEYVVTFFSSPPR